MIETLTKAKDNIRKEQIKGYIFYILSLIATLIGIVSLSILLVYVFTDSIGWLDWDFVTGTPSRFPEKAGIYPVLMGSIFLIMATALFTLPLGVGAAVYLEEYAKDSKLKRMLEMNISNLAGIPSIVYGLLGLGFFVSTLGMQHGTVIIGAFTLTLRILPIVIVSSQEALKAVPDSLRQASYGLGTTRWQMIKTVSLPESIPGIMTGMILALANGIGETAPLIMIGAASAIFSAPNGLFSPFGALPLQIYKWSDNPLTDFQHGVTPAAIVVLLIILLLMNGAAVLIRNKFTRDRK